MAQTFQPSTKDNYMSSGNSSTNYGSGDSMVLYNASNTDRLLISFDVSSWAGGSAGISNAKVYLYYFDNAGLDPVGLTANIYKLRRNDWNETESTWSLYKAANSWGTAGAGNTTSDIDTTLNGSFVFPASFGFIECDITNIVKDAIDNVSGIVNLRVSYDSEGSGSQLGIFYTREYATDTTKCPKLIITGTDVTVTLSGETGTWTGGNLAFTYVSTISGAICNIIGGAINALTSPAWTNENKNTTVTFTNPDKNDATMVNEDKNTTSSFTNENKN